MHEPNKQITLHAELCLTASVTSISYTFLNVSRSKKSSFPFPCPFLTEVPVTTSLSSGLKQQSVLVKNTVKEHELILLESQLYIMSNKDSL